MDSPEASALAAVLNFLQSRYGARCVLGVKLEREQTRLRLKIDLDPAPFESGREEVEDGMTETERAIFNTLADSERPLKGESVARRAQKTYNSHFKKVLADMKRAGELVMLEGGYWLADREEPGQGAGQSPGQ